MKREEKKHRRIETKVKGRTQVSEAGGRGGGVVSLLRGSPVP